MLSFADPSEIDNEIAHSLAHASDVFLDGNSGEETRDAIADAIANRPGTALLGTLRPLAAALFSRYSVGNPDATASHVADQLAQLVIDVFGCSDRPDRVETIKVAGQLVASDFCPADQEVVDSVNELSSVHLIVGVTQCVVTMSAVLAHLVEMPGGDAIRWVLGSLPDPDPQARVVLAGKD